MNYPTCTPKGSQSPTFYLATSKQTSPLKQLSLARHSLPLILKDIHVGRLLILCCLLSILYRMNLFLISRSHLDWLLCLGMSFLILYFILLLKGINLLIRHRNEQSIYIYMFITINYNHLYNFIITYNYLNIFIIDSSLFEQLLAN